MTAYTYIEGLGRASMCAVSRSHRPAPMRYVFHHILPQACGGLTTAANTVQLCDNCHLAVHVLMYQMKIRDGAIVPSPVNNRVRVALATRGYREAVAAGTVNKIPNEGSAVL